MIPTSEDLVKMFKNPPKEKTVQFAQIDSNYTSGRPALLFDGETVVTGKLYPYLDSYTPVAGDKVMLVKGVIIGKVV